MYMPDKTWKDTGLWQQRFLTTNAVLYLSIHTVTLSVRFDIFLTFRQTNCHCQHPSVDPITHLRYLIQLFTTMLIKINVLFILFFEVCTLVPIQCHVEINFLSTKRIIFARKIC